MRKNDDWDALNVLWQHKRLYLYTCIAALLCSLGVSLSIPDQYVSRVIVSPETKFSELSVGTQSGKLRNLLKDQSKWAQTGPDIYIEILGTSDFRNAVKKLSVKTGDGKFKGSYQKYLETYSDFPLFNNILGEKTLDDKVDDNVKYSLDRGNATITIQVRACDPYLAASMPNMIKALLQERIAERYHNLYKNQEKFYRKSLKEAEADYHAKMDEYTRFKDSHVGVEDMTYMTVQTALQRDMRTAYALCEKMRTMAERSRMLSVKKDTYLTTLVNPMVAQGATNPHYIANALIWLFYTLVFTTLFILYRQKIKMSKRKEDTGDE